MIIHKNVTCVNTFAYSNVCQHTEPSCMWMCAHANMWWMVLNNVPHVFSSWCDSWHAFCHPKRAMWCSGNVCLHTGWSCLIAQLLCHRATIGPWWHGHTCFHTCYVLVLPCGGLACLFACFSCPNATIFSLGTPVHYLPCSSANNWRAGHNFACLLSTSSGMW